MAVNDFPRWAVQAAITRGVSATDALRQFRTLGGRVRTQTWYRLYGLVEQERLNSIDEAARPLHRVPTATEILERESSRPGAYHQEVVVLLRDQEGEVVARNMAVRTRVLRSRRWAIGQAMQAWQGGGEGSPLTPIGAMYFGTFRLVAKQ